MGEELFPAFAEDACILAAASGAVAIAESDEGAFSAFFGQGSGLGGGESSVCPGFQHFLPCVGEDIAELQVLANMEIAWIYGAVVFYDEIAVAAWSERALRMFAAN